MNLSTWTSVEALASFAYSGRHLDVLRRRRAWFERTQDAMLALWWVPAGMRPTTTEAEYRVKHLRRHGPNSGRVHVPSTFRAAVSRGAERET